MLRIRAAVGVMSMCYVIAWRGGGAMVCGVSDGYIYNVMINCLDSGLMVCVLFDNDMTPPLLDRTEDKY